MATYRVTGIRLAGGAGHEHISHIQVQGSTLWTKQDGVSFLGHAGNGLYVQDAKGAVNVGVVNETPPYLRTHADGRWSDNLLALPRC